MTERAFSEHNLKLCWVSGFTAHEALTLFWTDLPMPLQNKVHRLFAIWEAQSKDLAVDRILHLLGKLHQ